MKVSWVRGLLIFFLFFSIALKKNDVVELEQYFNARYSANFLKSTKNVKFVVPPGTQGKIEEVKTFSSGNYGLQVTLQNGKNKGEKVWVYYRPSSPGMKLFKDETAKAEPTKVVEEAKSTTTTEPTTAWRTPAGEPIPLVVTKEYAEELMKKVDKVQEKIEVVESRNQKNPCDDDCKLAIETYGRQQTDMESKPSKPEVKAEVKAEKPKPQPSPQAKKELPPPAKSYPQPPLEKKGPAPQAAGVRGDNELPKTQPAAPQAEPVRPASFQDAPTMRNIPYTENRSRFNFPKCGGATSDLNHCSEAGLGITEIQVVNYLSRRSTPGELMKNRKWAIAAPGAARQDASISITDDLGGNNSSLKESVIMLFPRVTMPSVRSQGNKNVVTLPSGETATFEKGTGRVVGGVFSEQPMAAGQTPRVTYTGNKLMIRANNSTRGGDARLGGTATVTKQGKTCTVPKKNLWRQSEKDGQGFKFFSDKDLDAYLKSTCGFGIY